LRPRRRSKQRACAARSQAAIADVGEHAVRRFLEFFAANIRNKNTRIAILTISSASAIALALR